MDDGKYYPRVLIVYQTCINRADQTGGSLRGWFADWPRERLAQIYSGGESGEERFCGSNFRLGPGERRLGKLFFRLKNSKLGEAAMATVNCPERPTRGARGSLSGRARRRVGRFVLGSGLWELLFSPRLSEQLVRWVREFQPEIIYCQGYTLGFTWLPLMLRRKFALPICFQTGDDWLKSRYSRSSLRFVMSPLVRLSARRLVRASAVRLSTGEAMSDEYLGRYKVRFEPLMQGDDISRFEAASPRRVVGGGRISVVYSGNLGSLRCEPLIDVCTAAQELRADGLDVMVTALATSVPPEAVELFEKTPNLTVIPAPSHEELPAYLKGADLLLLPESFDARQAQSIRFSISTKAQLYMMSERPVLVYAHPDTGIMDYARRTGWACRVERQDRRLLKDALKRLITDAAYRRQLVSKGREIAMQRHDSTVIRERFRALLSESVMAGAADRRHRGAGA